MENVERWIGRVTLGQRYARDAWRASRVSDRSSVRRRGELDLQFRARRGPGGGRPLAATELRWSGGVTARSRAKFRVGRRGGMAAAAALAFLVRRRFRGLRLAL